MFTYRFIFLVCAMLMGIDIAAQKQNNNWFFGHNAGVSFSSGSPVAITKSPFSQNEGTACISDANGKFLFYTDGDSVWGANLKTMPNGFGLKGHNSSSQSALIVPKPGDCNIYYIFTTPAQDTITPMYYSVVDMTLNSGLGDITSKNIPLYHPVTERIYATLKSNNFDYWVVAKTFGANTFACYSVTAAGVAGTPVLSNIGFQSVDWYDALGYVKISPDHRKLCYVSVYGAGYSQLFDFDNATGIISNPVQLPSYACYGVEFSPDNSKVYLATINAPYQLWQYDLAAGTNTDIVNSKTLVFDAFASSNPWQYGGALQTGPNGKIYACRLQAGFIGCINNPNSKGLSCNYVDSAVSLLGNHCLDGLPNSILKYSGKQDSACNAAGTDTTKQGCEISLETRIFPTPFERVLVINKNPTICKVNLMLYNVLGQLILKDVKISDGRNEIVLDNLAAGVYFFVLYAENKILKTGKILRQ